MLLAIESVILCAVFSIIILPPLYKNPISQIMSYPPAIRKRVEQLPEYEDSVMREEKKQVVRKVCACFLTVFIFAVVAYFSGAKTFGTAFWHTFVLFTVVNLYDVIVFDMIMFCHSKRLVIKGTEDMKDEYRNPIHHLKGGVKGIVIGALVALLAGGIVHLIAG